MHKLLKINVMILSLAQKDKEKLNKIIIILMSFALLQASK